MSQSKSTRKRFCKLCKLEFYTTASVLKNHIETYHNKKQSVIEIPNIVVANAGALNKLDVAMKNTKIKTLR